MASIFLYFNLAYIVKVREYDNIKIIIDKKIEVIKKN